MKIKEVEKGSTSEELGFFVTILDGYKERPIEKVVSFVKVRIRDSIVALP